MPTDRIPVGVSSCLLGNPVRYDGGHKRDALITGVLAEHFEFHPFCPEVGIGLGVPRPTIRLVAAEGGPRAVGTRDRNLDVTDALWEYGAARAPEVARLSGFIFKKGSPSCGMAGVGIHNARGVVESSGAGLFAAGVTTRFPALPVEEEGRLGGEPLRENFIQRVFIYHDWRTRVAPAPTVALLKDFHARLELSLMSRDRDSGDELGRLVDEARNRDSADVVGLADDYIAAAMACLRRVPTRDGHVEVLRHLYGCLEHSLEAGDRAALADAIGQYRHGQVSLVVPVTLLRHHLRHHPDPRIGGSWYMDGYRCDV